MVWLRLNEDEGREALFYISPSLSIGFGVLRTLGLSSARFKLSDLE